MKLKDPILELKFYKGDVKDGRPLLQRIGKDGIAARSVSVTHRLFSDLRSASDTASVTILGSLPVVEDIITAEGGIKARLSDGGAPLFTGWLSTSYSWTVTDHGVRTFTLRLEDMGTRLLEKPFIENGAHLFRCTAEEVVRAVAEKAGVTLAPSFPELTEEVTYTVAAGTPAKELLSSLLYELGYVYRFNAEGEMEAYGFNLLLPAESPVLDHAGLYSVGGTAVSLSKSIRRYGTVRISYTALGEADDYLVYSNATGRGDGHTYCYLPLKAGERFDGSAVLPDGDDGTVLPRIEAVNASGETETVGSGDIIAVSGLRPVVETDSGYVRVSIEAAGGPYITVSAENTGSLEYHVLRLDVRASIIYSKSTNVIRTGTGPEASESGSTLEEEMEWVHGKTAASRHATLLARYHGNAEAVYSFHADESLEPGSFVRLTDTVHSGLAVTILVSEKTVTDESTVASFRAVGISSFNLDDDVVLETFICRGGPVRGEDGRSYTVAIASSNGNVFRPSNISTRLSCQVLENNTDITSTLEEWRFRWTRTSTDATGDGKWNTSSKVLGHRDIEITEDDCCGRTVFTCTVEI